MREDIKQLKDIMSMVKRLKEIMAQSQEIKSDIFLDTKETINAVNKSMFEHEVLDNYTTCEMIEKYMENSVTKEELLFEISKWYELVNEKIEFMEKKTNYIDYEFYSLMNYVELMPHEIILKDMERNFNGIKKYGEEVYKQRVAHFNRYVDFWGAINIEEGIFDLFHNRINELKNHREDFIWLYEELEDYRSKFVLNGILQFWVKYDLSLINKMRENNYESYYDLDIIKSDENEVVVDLGAYTGDSAEDFIHRMGSYKQIYCYEISKDTFEILKQNMAPYENVTLVNKGIGEQEGVMYLERSKDASANKVAEAGEEAIEITTLDIDIKEKITFIKMDIEGAEQAALKGAKHHIQCDRPKLAICTYHNNHDIWQIPRMMREMNPDYKLYMRYNGAVNGFNVSEFVTFAV